MKLVRKRTLYVPHSFRGPLVPDHADGTEARQPEFPSWIQTARGGDTSEEAPWSQLGDWYGHIRMFWGQAHTLRHHGYDGKVTRICTLPSSKSGGYLITTIADHDDGTFIQVHRRITPSLTFNVTTDDGHLYQSVSFELVVHMSSKNSGDENA
jgi:hypothetical protein